MKLPLIAVITAVLGSPCFAAYSLTPVYPVPGGTTFSGSGVAGQSAGRTQFYSGIDESQYTDLVWTFTSIQNPYHSSEGSSGGDMVYAGYNSATGLMTWNSTSNATWSTAFGTQNTATKLVVQFQPYTGVASGPLGSGFLVPVTASAEGLASALGNVNNWPLVDVDATGVQDQFQIWYQFQTSGGTPLLAYYDGSSSFGGALNTGLSGGFFVAVPEPSGVTLVALGFCGLLAKRRKA